MSYIPIVVSTLVCVRYGNFDTWILHRGFARFYCMFELLKLSISFCVRTTQENVVSSKVAGILVTFFILKGRGKECARRAKVSNVCCVSFNQGAVVYTAVSFTSSLIMRFFSSFFFLRLLHPSPPTGVSCISVLCVPIAFGMVPLCSLFDMTTWLNVGTKRFLPQDGNQPLCLQAALGGVVMLFRFFVGGGG